MFRVATDNVLHKHTMQEHESYDYHFFFSGPATNPVTPVVGRTEQNIFKFEKV